MTRPVLHLSAASGLPFYRQITAQLADAIRAGELAPGTQLPSVRELATELLVSGVTVRRAYVDLVSLGLVVQRQGAGTYVAPRRRSPRAEAVRRWRAAVRAAVEQARAEGLMDDELREAFEACLAGMEVEA